MWFGGKKFLSYFDGFMDTMIQIFIANANYGEVIKLSLTHLQWTHPINPKY